MDDFWAIWQADSLTFFVKSGDFSRLFHLSCKLGNGENGQFLSKIASLKPYFLMQNGHILILFTFYLLV